MSTRICTISLSFFLAVVTAFLPSTESDSVETSTVLTSQRIQVTTDSTVDLENIDPYSPRSTELVTKLLEGSGESMTLQYSPASDNYQMFAELNSLANDTVACGDSRAVASPDAGIAGQGEGATVVEAILAAVGDNLDKMMAYSRIKCASCDDPEQCQRFITFLQGAFELVDITALPDGTFSAVVKYTGPYFAHCSPCDL